MNERLEQGQYQPPVPLPPTRRQTFRWMVPWTVRVQSLVRQVGDVGNLAFIIALPVVIYLVFGSGAAHGEEWARHAQGRRAV
jgi:hypothetical protein